MHSRRHWPLTRRDGRSDAQLHMARVHLGAAMLDAMANGAPTVSVDVGDATDLVFEALDRVAAADEARRPSLEKGAAG
jgi:hypothetical protein